MAAKPQTKSAFHVHDVHPGLARMHTIVANLKEKTGRPLEEWLALIEKAGPPPVKERLAWLKANYGLGLNYASCIAEMSAGAKDEYSPEGYLRAAEQYVEKMFAGPKAG